MQHAQASRSRRLVALKRAATPSLIERALFVSFALVAIGFTHIFGAQDAEGGSPLAELIWLGAYALAFVGIAQRSDVAMPLVARCAPLLLLLSLAFLSTTWSFDPLLTLRRAFGLTGTTVIALYLVSRYPLETFLETFVITVDIVALISLVLVFAVPSLGVMQQVNQGSWCGLFVEKNHLGATMQLGIVTMLVMLADSRRRWFLVISIALCALLLVGSRSFTSIAGLSVVGALIAALRWGRNVGSIGRVFVIAFLILGGFAIIASTAGFTIDDLLGVFGKNITLTGRDEVWSDALTYASQKPLLGYGYQVFWEPTGPASAVIASDVGWTPTNAHNGFLQVALDLGSIGVILLVMFLGISIKRSIGSLRRAPQKWIFAWPFFVLLATGINNLAEATYLSYNEVLWLAVVAAALYATAGYRLHEVTSSVPLVSRAESGRKSTYKSSFDRVLRRNQQTEE